MALVVYDRVQEVTATTGTGTLTLGGAVTGFQSFAVVGNGNTTYYTIVNGSAWEVGIGTYSSTGPTLARTTILSNSNGNTSPINLVGASNVFVTYPAEKSINYDANDVATIGSTLGYSDTGIIGSFASTTAGYNQVIVQNKSTATNASSNFNVSNDAATSTTGYAELGINSSTYTGTGSFNIAGASYLASASTDLTIGTYGAYNVHFVTNSNTTDAMTIYNSGGVSLGGYADPGIGTLYANNVYLGYNTITAAAGTTILTNASAAWQNVVGTTTQTIQLPNATTLYKGLAFTVTSSSTGAVTVKDNASATIDTVVTGGSAILVLTDNSTSAGTWVAYSYIPSSYDFSATTANFGGATITNATWNGSTIGTAYGGTGLTGFGSANYALYSTSSSALAAGTLPTAAGGTNLTSYTTGDVIYASATNVLSKLGIGSNGQVLTSNGTIPTWSTPASNVSSFQTSLSGLTPNTATTGAVTLAGTLGATSGGTGQSTYTTGDILYASATNTLSKLADVATGNALISGGVGVAPSWGKVGLTTHVSGTLPTANGGTNLTTFTAGNNALYSTDASTLTAGTLPIAAGGTGQTTANAAFNALVPSQTSNSGKYLTTNGTNTSWATVAITPAAVSDQANTSTGYFGLPSGTTAQRPGSPASGYTRFNTTLNAVECYSGVTSKWEIISYFTVPGAPTIGTATATGSTTATVTYTAPTDTGAGSSTTAITSYTAVASPGGQTGTVSQSGSGTITVTGLTTGTAYTFTVYATNAAGNGASSSASNSITTWTVPGAPTIGTATDTGTSSAQASITYTAPVNNGGTAITSYTAVSSPGGITGSLSTAGSGTIVVTGLTAATAYTFTVYATNAVGNSASSAASNSVTVTTTPGAPTIGTATASGLTASVPYTAPASNGGATITSYTAVSSPGGITGTLSTAGSGTITVSGLAAGTTYTFTVYATNAKGNGASSSASNSVTTKPATFSADYVVVAGGAGGGCNGGGGGGAGGMLTGTSTVTTGASYTITVGGGGSGAAVNTAKGGSGGTSSYTGTGVSVSTTGGGGGGSDGPSNASGVSGGSGGGVGRNGINGSPGSGTAGQGNSGGTMNVGGNYGSGGGGGKTAAGGNGNASNSGPGGAGGANTITGSTTGQLSGGTYYLAGGGGGGMAVAGGVGAGGLGGGGAGVQSATGVAGTTNTGGGGGGGGPGGNGGSGVVIISMLTSYYSGTQSGATVTTSGSNTILTFTTSGSFTA